MWNNDGAIENYNNKKHIDKNTEIRTKYPEKNVYTADYTQVINIQVNSWEVSPSISKVLLSFTTNLHMHCFKPVSISHLNFAFSRIEPERQFCQIKYSWFKRNQQ